MIGVESTEIKSKANAMKSSTVKGVAGRNMVTIVSCSRGQGGSRIGERRSGGRRRQDAAGEGVADQFTGGRSYLVARRVRD